jgi:hypothetical protein
MAMQEEHIMDIALNGENYCSAIHRRQPRFGRVGLECSHHR